MACSVNLSCMNANSNNICTVKLGNNKNGPDSSCVALCMCINFGRNLAMHVHFVVWHEHCRSHGWLVLSWGWLSMLPAFVSV